MKLEFVAPFRRSIVCGKSLVAGMMLAVSAAAACAACEPEPPGSASDEPATSGSEREREATEGTAPSADAVAAGTAAASETAGSDAEPADDAETRDGERALELVTRRSVEAYERVRTLAVAAANDDDTALADAALGERLLALQMLSVLGPEHLSRMDGSELLAFAVDHGMLGRYMTTHDLDSVTVVNRAIATGKSVRPSSDASEGDEESRDGASGTGEDDAGDGGAEGVGDGGVEGVGDGGADGASDDGAEEVDEGSAQGTTTPDGATPSQSEMPWQFVREDGRWKVDLAHAMQYAGTLLAQNARANQLSPSAFLARYIEEAPTPEPIDPWRRVEVPDAELSFELPGPPKKNTEKHADDIAFEWHTASSVHGGRYAVGWARLPAPPEETNGRRRLLSATLRGVSRELGGRVMDLDDDVTIDGAELAWQVRLARPPAGESDSAPEHVATMRLVLAGDRLIQLAYVGTGRARMSDVERFLESLTLE